MTENLPVESIPENETLQEKLKRLNVDVVKNIVDIYDDAKFCEDKEGELKIKLAAMKILQGEINEEKKANKEKGSPLNIFVPMKFNPDGSVNLPAIMQQRTVIEGEVIKKENA